MTVTLFIYSWRFKMSTIFQTFSCHPESGKIYFKYFPRYFTLDAEEYKTFHPFRINFQPHKLFEKCETAGYFFLSFCRLNT
jgi:hypothetical protein